MLRCTKPTGRPVEQVHMQVIPCTDDASEKRIRSHKAYCFTVGIKEVETPRLQTKQKLYGEMNRYTWKPAILPGFWRFERRSSRLLRHAKNLLGGNIALPVWACRVWSIWTELLNSLPFSPQVKIIKREEKMKNVERVKLCKKAMVCVCCGGKGAVHGPVLH